MVDAKVQIRRAAVRLAAVHAHARELSLQVALVRLVALELPGRKPATMLGFGVLEQCHC